MVQVRGQSIIKLLSIIFQNCIGTGTLTGTWNLATWQLKPGNWHLPPVHKKRDKQIVDNYRSVSLLTIFRKIFEKVTFKLNLNIFNSNLLCPNQSGFRPSDSCEYQLFSKVHEI